MNFRIKHFLLLALCNSFVLLAGCGKQDGKVANSSSNDRIGAINSTYEGSIDYPQAQQNLKNDQPFIINDEYQINPYPGVNGFTKITSDQIRMFSVGSPSDPSKFFIEEADCKNYRLRIEPSDWIDAEAGKMSGRIVYVACHLPVG